MFAFVPGREQAGYLAWLTPSVAAQVAEHVAVTLRDGEGRIVGCCGIGELESGDCLAWALFADAVTAHAMSLVRIARRIVALFPGRRILAHVAADHAKAARFIAALDFKLSGRLELPDGRGVLLYARER